MPPAEPVHSGEAIGSRMRLGSKYILEEEVSREPAASIYRGMDVGSRQVVAVRLFRKRYQAAPRFSLRFREHLKVIARLSHENLVGILDYGMQEGHYYIVMEWTGGTDLGTYLSEHGPLSPWLAVSIARKVCAGIEAVHQHGLIHHDIKPQTILLRGDGSVKVSDAGLSGLLSESGLSRTNVMLGGVSYISPEQARGEVIGPASDIYSLGILLFEMLTNRPPFVSNDAWSVVRMHADQSPPSLDQFNPQVSDELGQIVLRSLQKEPGLRFASAAEMGDVLTALQNKHGVNTYEFSIPGLQSENPNRSSPAGTSSGFGSIIDLLVKPFPAKIFGRVVPFGFVVAVQFMVSYIIVLGILYLITGLLMR